MDSIYSYSNTRISFPCAVELLTDKREEIRAKDVTQLSGSALLQYIQDAYEFDCVDNSRIWSTVPNTSQWRKDNIPVLLMLACERGYDQLIRDLYQQDRKHQTSDVTKQLVTHRLYMYMSCAGGHTTCAEEILAVVYRDSASGAGRRWDKVRRTVKSFPGVGQGNLRDKGPLGGSCVPPYSLCVAPQAHDTDKHKSAGGGAGAATLQKELHLLNEYLTKKKSLGLCTDYEKDEDASSYWRAEISRNYCNCLRIAICNENSDTVKLLLDQHLVEVEKALKLPVNDHLTEAAGKSMYDDDCTALALLINKMPDLARRLFDRKLLQMKECSTSDADERQYTYDLALLGMPPQSPTSHTCCSCCSCCCCAGNISSSKRKKCHPLIQIYDSKNVELASHNYVSAYLYFKWHHVRLFHFLALAWYALFMGCFTTYMLNANRYKVGDEMKEQKTVKPTDIPAEDDTSTLVRLLAHMIIALCAGGILQEIIQIITQRCLYFEDWTQTLTNCIDWYMYVCSAYVVCFPIAGYRTSYQWELGATCILASWFAFLFHHPIFSTHLYLIVKVIVELWKFTLMFVLFLFMFGLTFSALLNNQNAHNSVPTSLIRTWTMMIGDIAYGELFFPDQDYFAVRYKYSTYVLFFLFLLLGVVITNMWTGFIISRLEGLERQMHLEKRKVQMDYILTMYMMLPRRIQRVMDACNRCCLHLIHRIHLSTSRVTWVEDHYVYVAIKQGKLLKIFSVIRVILGDMNFAPPDLQRFEKRHDVKQRTPDVSTRVQQLTTRVDDLNDKMDVMMSMLEAKDPHVYSNALITRRRTRQHRGQDSQLELYLNA